MKKLDIILAIVTGEATAWFFYSMIKTLELGIEFKNIGFVLAVIFPILAVIGLWVAWQLSKKFLFIFQIAKFMLIGVLATILDLGILNFLITATALTSGVFYSVFKGASFLIATSAKYFGDKFWAFEKMEKGGMGKEFGKFFLVTMVGLAVNVGLASLIVNVMGPQFGLNEKVWANVGGILAAFGTVLWNFLGYKFLVFKK